MAQDAGGEIRDGMQAVPAMSGRMYKGIPMPPERTPTGGAVWLVIIAFALVLLGLVGAMIGLGFNTN